MTTNTGRKVGESRPRVQHQERNVDSSIPSSCRALGPSLQRPDSADSSAVCSSCEDDEAGTHVCEPCKAAALILDRCSYCGSRLFDPIECADAEEVERMRRFAVCDRSSCYFEARNG